MVASYDGSMIVTGSDEGEILSWNVEEGIRMQTFNGHSDGIRGLFLIQDGAYFISISRDRSIRIWDFTSAECVSTIEVGDVLCCGVINPTTTRLFTGSNAKTIKEWCNTFNYQNRYFLYMNNFKATKRFLEILKTAGDS